MATQKPLTLEDRYAIQHALEKRHSFRTIARSLDKDPTTISKEVRRHRQSRYYVGQGRHPNRCIHHQLMLQQEMPKDILQSVKSCEFYFSPDCEIPLNFFVFGLNRASPEWFHPEQNFWESGRP